MKNIFKLIMVWVAVVALMASCQQEIVKADYDFVPAENQKGFTFFDATEGNSYEYGYTDSVYTVTVFRNYTEGDEWLPLTYGAHAQYFELPDSIYFEDGRYISSFDIDVRGWAPGTEVTITAAFDAPVATYFTYDSAAIVHMIDHDLHMMRANAEKAERIAWAEAIRSSITADAIINRGGYRETEITFMFEYTWVSKGIVLFVSNWEGAQGEVEIQQALEYSDAAGNHYMRLNSPYYYVAPDYCSAAGKHAYFYLDKDYNAGNDLVPAGIQPVEDAYGWYWHPNYVVQGYNKFINQGNIYMISVLWNALGTTSLYQPTNEMWQWNADHYNAAKADPNWKYE